MIRVFSSGIRHIPHLEAFLGEPVVTGAGTHDKVTAVAGWGYRPSARRARRYAERKGLRYVALEDAFLRSVQPGPLDQPLGIVVDDEGIYYDAGRPSRLESLIRTPLSEAERTRAMSLIEAWRAGRVSKYNHLREHDDPLPEPYVLAVDQTRGDASVRYGQADAEGFQQMLQAALQDHPDTTVVVKVHPDVAEGRKRGYFDLNALARMERVSVLGTDEHPVRLIEHARAVYTVTSQMGFEGLLWNKPVHTFGMPFYAGWGLTADALPAPERRGIASLEQLVHSALVGYPRYVHPETGCRAEVEDILAHITLQRHMRQRFPAELYAAGFSPYKRPLVRRYCWGSRVRFVRKPEQAPDDATLVVWGDRTLPGQTDAIRLEDGFLRSVGLGADLIRPLSWVMDRRGIYYDPRTPSDLEHLLETAEFPPALLARAADLRQRILAANLTKYNVGEAEWHPPTHEGDPTSDTPNARPVILVPGQVESDASVARGAPGGQRNIDLLRTVRMERPEAWVVYKPHPDVAAGLRAAGDDEESAERWCDEIVTDASMGALLRQVDEVYTLTSLAGFEALLRGKRVTCLGQPFYAGWGLTSDRLPIERRRRRLTVDELTAGALILYPTYVSRTTGRFTTPERALDELLTWRAASGGKLPTWRRLLRFALRASEPRLGPAKLARRRAG